jgi:hypothetical protein
LCQPPIGQYQQIFLYSINFIIFFGGGSRVHRAAGGTVAQPIFSVIFFVCCFPLSAQNLLVATTTQWMSVDK